MVASTRRITYLLLAVSASSISAFAPISPAVRPVTQLAANNKKNDNNSMMSQFANVASLSILATTLLFNPLPSHADGQTKEFKLPPIDQSDKSRCVLNSSKMGQANAARDKLYDLRECKLSGVKGAEFDLSGVIMTDTDVTNANISDEQFSKVYFI